MTTKERITKLIKVFSPQEVAETVGVTVSYVYRVLREINPKKLTLPNYIEALQMGITDKVGLAQYFGVGRSTLWRFEQKNMTRELTAKFLYTLNGKLESVKNDLALTNAETAELAQLPTIADVKKDLQTILTEFKKFPLHKEQPFADYCKAIAAALKSLSNC